MAEIGLGLKRFREAHGVDKTTTMFREALAGGKIRKDEIHIRELTESLVGPNWATMLRGRWCGLREAIDAVDSSGFAAITGQLLIQEVKAFYQSPEFVLKSLISEQQITNGNLGPQRVPYLSKVPGPIPIVNQGQAFPSVGFSGGFYDLPAPVKKGEICSITFEMIFSDLTKQCFDAAGSVGEMLGIDEEEQKGSVVYGLTNPLSWNGTAYSTYQATTPWVNLKSGVTIVDWNDLNTLEQMFVDMTDPVTGKVIRITPNAALVTPYRYYNWRRTLSATSTHTGAYPTTGQAPQITAANPLPVEYPVYKTPYGYQQLVASGLTSTQAREYVVFGDFKKAFLWRYVRPLEIVEAPPQSPAEFEQEIVYRLKGSIFGCACVQDPRYAVQAYNT